MHKLLILENIWGVTMEVEIRAAVMKAQRLNIHTNIFTYFDVEKSFSKLWHVIMRYSVYQANGLYN
jgi:hypothetical protein